jgi:basic amino acid/polyamine antiporter, APA family
VATLATAFAYEGWIIATTINAELLEAGDQAPVKVMSLVFGRLGGSLLTVFVIVSCLGTPTGLIMGSVRGMYSIASRDLGPRPGYFKVVHPGTNSTNRSALLGFILSAFWMVVWYGNFAGWWGGFMDISELPIAILYLIYILIQVWMIRKLDYLHLFGRYVAPIHSGRCNCLGWILSDERQG